MSDIFECHVVYNPSEKTEIIQAAAKYGFSMSYIVGDEDLGDIRLLYLTKRASSFAVIDNEMMLMMHEINPEPIRYKIEVTLVDVLKPERVKHVAAHSASQHLPVFERIDGVDAPVVCQTES